MIETPKPIHTYKKITKQNADKFFNDCMLVKHDRISWIIDFSVLQGAERSRLDLTKESLDYLWGFVVSHITFSSPKISRDRFNNGDLPEWFAHLYDAFGHEAYSNQCLWIFDCLFYYFGEVFVKSYDHISWQLIVSNRYEMTCMPHIVSKEWVNFRFCPWQQVRTAMGGVSANVFTPKLNVFTSAFEGMIELGKM